MKFPRLLDEPRPGGEAPGPVMTTLTVLAAVLVVAYAAAQIVDSGLPGSSRALWVVFGLTWVLGATRTVAAWYRYRGCRDAFDHGR